MADSISTKRFVAFHEAGHAVAADFYNIEFTATIVGQPHVQLGQVDPEINCIIVAAGPLAEAKFQRRSLTAVYLTHGSGDVKYLQERAELWAAVLPGSRFEVWRQSAKMIINRRWSAVQAVATQLLASGTLSSSKIRRLVAQSLPQRLDG